MLVACISLEIFVGVVIMYIGNLHYYRSANSADDDDTTSRRGSRVTHSRKLGSACLQCFDTAGWASAGFVRCKKKNRNAKNTSSVGARAYIGVWGRCPQRGPGAEPLKLKAFYCRREQICHSHRLSET